LRTDCRTVSRGLRSVRGEPEGNLVQQDAGAADFLAAQGAEEVRDQTVHQLEVRRQRGRVLLRVVENLLAIPLRIDRRARAAVDEDEFRLKEEPFALHESARRYRAAPAEAVEDFLIALDERVGRFRP